MSVKDLPLETQDEMRMREVVESLPNSKYAAVAIQLKRIIPNYKDDVEAIHAIRSAWEKHGALNRETDSACDGVRSWQYLFPLSQRKELKVIISADVEGNTTFYVSNEKADIAERKLITHKVIIQEDAQGHLHFNTLVPQLPLLDATQFIRDQIAAEIPPLTPETFVSKFIVRALGVIKEEIHHTDSSEYKELLLLMHKILIGQKYGDEKQETLIPCRFKGLPCVAQVILSPESQEAITKVECTADASEIEFACAIKIDVRKRQIEFLEYNYYVPDEKTVFTGADFEWKSINKSLFAVLEHLERNLEHYEEKLRARAAEMLRVGLNAIRNDGILPDAYKNFFLPFPRQLVRSKSGDYFVTRICCGTEELVIRERFTENGLFGDTVDILYKKNQQDTENVVFSTILPLRFFKSARSLMTKPLSSRDNVTLTLEKNRVPEVTFAEIALFIGKHQREILRLDQAMEPFFQRIWSAVTVLAVNLKGQSTRFNVGNGGEIRQAKQQESQFSHSFKTEIHYENSWSVVIYEECVWDGRRTGKIHFYAFPGMPPRNLKNIPYLEVDLNKGKISLRDPKLIGETRP